jgi:DNA invertase Pin-like site-specific DNA recombinase
MAAATLATERATRLIGVYQRVSTDAQDLSRQASQVELAQSENPGREIHVFREDGVSAFHNSVFERPVSAEICRLIEAGEMEKVYTDAQDRLSRGDDLEWITFRTLCQTHGTRLIIDGRELRDDLGGRLEGYLKALVARQESEEKSHRTASGIAAIARAGYWPYGPAPFGYDAVPDPEHPKGWRILIPNQDAPRVQRALVRFAFDQGTSISSIGREIGQSRANTTRIVDYVAYAGRVRYREETFPGRHEPLIAEAVYEGIQRRRRQNAEHQARYPQVHPYGSLIRCPHCGKPTHHHQTGRNSRGRNNTYIRCESRGCRKYVAIPENVDAAVALGLYATAVTLHERLDDPTWAVTAPKADQLAQVEDQLARVRAAEDDIVDLITSRELDKERAKPKLADLARQREQLQAAQARLADDGTKLRSDLESLRNRLFTLGLDIETVTHASIERFLAAWHEADIEDKRWLLHDTTTRIDLHDGKLPNPAIDWNAGYLELTFKAGITIPVPFYAGRRDSVSKILRGEGFGRPATEAPSAFKPIVGKRAGGARTVPASSRFRRAFPARAG